MFRLRIYLGKHGKRVLLLSAAVALVVVWLAFRHHEPGRLELLIVGRTNVPGPSQVLLLLTNGTRRDYRILSVNAERYVSTNGPWRPDPLAMKGLAPPKPVLSARSGFVLICDLPEPKVPQRYTMLYLLEENVTESLAADVCSLLGKPRQLVTETLSAEVEP